MLKIENWYFSWLGKAFIIAVGGEFISAGTRLGGLNETDVDCRNSRLDGACGR